MKMLSVYRSNEGIIVERRNEFGTNFKKAFETEDAMLEYLDVYKQTEKVIVKASKNQKYPFDVTGEYRLNLSNEFAKLVLSYLSK